MNETDTGLPDLETQCDRCGGDGTIRPRGDTESCPRCDGTGYRLTAAGEVIVALMNRHFRRFVRELADRQ
jgi:DnaJ-class molecular chaperone